MKRRNSTRDRTTAELHALRRLVHELEARVLQSPSPRVVRDVQSLWKRLAERQRRACAASQRENARLLRDVQRCADWIERLWVLLRETRQMDDLARDAQRNIRARDAAVLAELKHDVAPRTTWASAYATFQAHGFCLGTSPDALDDRWSRTIESTGRRCSLVVARHLPFDALATSAALWSSLAVVGHSVTNGRSHDTGHTVVLERSQTACAMTYKIDDSLILGDDKPLIRCHAVVQTVVARGKARDKACDALVANCATLFAWHSISSASSRLHSASASARDTMWVAVSTSAGGTGSSTVWIVAESQLDELPSTMPTLLESMLRATEYCVTEMLETAENALMDTLQSRRDRLATSDGIAEGCTV
jgi:hypothetical protein